MASMIRSRSFMRQIPLAAINEAAESVYQAAIRTPLVRLDLPFRDVGAAAAGDLPQARIAAADWLIQDSRRVERGAKALARDTLKDGVWTVSAGNAAQGVAFAARRAGVPCSVMVMDTAPQTKLRSIERLGAHDRQGHLRRMLADRRGARVRRACTATSCTRSTTTTSSPATRPPDSRFSRTCRTWTRSSRPRRRRVAGRDRLGDARAEARACKIYAAEPETAAPLATSLARGEASYFDQWKPSFVDGAGGKSVLPTMWPLLEQRRRRLDRHVARRGAAGDEQDRRSRARRRRRRRGLCDCRGAQRPRRHRKNRRRRLRRQHRPLAIRVRSSTPVRNISANKFPKNVFRSPLHCPAAFIVSTSSRSTCGGAGIPAARKSSASSITRCGGSPRTTRCGCC